MSAPEFTESGEGAIRAACLTLVDTGLPAESVGTADTPLALVHMCNARAYELEKWAAECRMVASLLLTEVILPQALQPKTASIQWHPLPPGSPLLN